MTTFAMNCIKNLALLWIKGLALLTNEYLLLTFKNVMYE